MSFDVKQMREPREHGGVVMRPLELDDYQKGFCDLLGELTVCGSSFEEFKSQYARMTVEQRGVNYCVVAESSETGKIVATAMLVVEQKFIHKCGRVGLIEDVVVHDSLRGKGVGAAVVSQLVHVGKGLGCYKIILNCSQLNVPFYEKSGFKNTGFEMALYF